MYAIITPKYGPLEPSFLTTRNHSFSDNALIEGRNQLMEDGMDALEAAVALLNYKIVRIVWEDCQGSIRDCCRIADYEGQF